MGLANDHTAVGLANDPAPIPGHRHCFVLHTAGRPDRWGINPHTKDLHLRDI